MANGAEAFVFFFNYLQVTQWAGIRDIGEQIKQSLDPNDEGSINAKTINKCIHASPSEAEAMRPTTKLKFEELYALHPVIEKIPDSAAWEFNIKGWQSILTFGCDDSDVTPGFKHCDQLLVEAHEWMKEFRSTPQSDWSNFFVKNPFFYRYLPKELIETCRRKLNTGDFLENVSDRSIIKAIVLTNVSLLLESLAWIDADFISTTSDNPPESYYSSYIPKNDLKHYYPHGILIKKWVTVLGGSKSAAELICSEQSAVDNQRSTIDKWIRGTEKPRFATVIPLLQKAVLCRNPALPENMMRVAISSQRILWIICTLLTNMSRSLTDEYDISDKELLNIYQKYESFLFQAKSSIGI